MFVGGTSGAEEALPATNQRNVQKIFLNKVFIFLTMISLKVIC